MKYQILIGGEWVDGMPTENGQKYRIVHDNGGIFESYWAIPEEDKE